MLFAALATMLMQSSTASIGLTLAMGEAGVVDLPMMIAVVIGTNLGLGLTSLVAGWSTWEGRRLALANLLLKCLVAGGMLLAFDPLAGMLAAGGLAGAARGEPAHGLQPHRRPDRHRGRGPPLRLA